MILEVRGKNSLSTSFCQGCLPSTAHTHAVISGKETALSRDAFCLFLSLHTRSFLLPLNRFLGCFSLFLSFLSSRTSSSIQSRSGASALLYCSPASFRLGHSSLPLPSSLHLAIVPVFCTSFSHIIPLSNKHFRFVHPGVVAPSS